MRPFSPTRVVAYLVSRFPAITETFILYEILELERRGLRVEIFSLLRHREAIAHPEAASLIRRTCYGGLRLFEIIAAHLHYLMLRPRAYFDAVWGALRGNWRSLEFLARALFVVLQAPMFARRMERAGVEHIHAHWATHPALAAWFIHRISGIPYSFTAHAHDLYVERTMLGPKLAEAEFAVTISEFNRRLLRSWYGAALARKVALVRCGVDAEVFTPRAPRTRGPTDPFTIVCVASLRDYKGHPHLIEACQKLRSAGLPMRCLLIGEGDERPRIEAQIQECGLQDCIELLGAQPRPRVRELLEKADVFALPSVVTSYGKMEGIPVALMEALACEVPVVATEISGVPELVEDGVTGMLVPPGNADALAEALLKLAEAPSWAQSLAATGRRRVMRDYNLRRNAAELADLLAGATVPAAPAELHALSARASGI